MSIQKTTIYFKGFYFKMNDIEERWKKLGINDSYDFINNIDPKSEESICDGMCGEYICLGKIIEQTDPYDYDSSLGDGCLKIEEVEIDRDYFIKKYKLNETHTNDELDKLFGNYIITHIT